FRQRRHLVTSLYFVNCIIIWRTVRPRSPNDPNKGRRRVDPRHARWDVPAPAGWSNKEVACLCAGGTPAGGGKYIGPHIKHWQQVISAIGIRRGNDHGLRSH